MLALSMTPGVAALRAEAVARIVNTIEPDSDFCHANHLTKNMPLVWRTDHVNAFVNVSACYIPFRFAELSTDVTTEVYSAARKN